MAERLFEETLGILREARTRTDSCLVAFSGGKDSLCVLDMCMRVFTRVECFFMYFIPGLEVCEKQLEWARKRYGVLVHQLPHWSLSYDLKDGTYIFPSWRLDDIEYIHLRDIYDLMIARTGIPLIPTGARRDDSLWRKRNLSNISHYTDVCHPLIGWSKADVMAYLDIHKIERPDSAGGNMNSVGLATGDLLWLHDKHPDDYRKICNLFPFAEAVVYRRQFHGVHGKQRKKRGAGAGRDAAAASDASAGSDE